ncbi:merozoite surface protein 1-like [Papilio machaon]|uniref:merozoite surface protein 1-like n=1 Tax=Papilio machaon TaxID=76193 RepID=UPI001E665D20|nr:merozoite surface protein 1-like [Papilio machaon]
MDLFLFLITIFCLPLITKTQPFIDCSGKSFLCENSTHFTICVDVGGGVSMTVGNIVLSCPPTTFCDENNTFECEYRTSTSITPIPTSQGTDITTETTEARLTTNIYDEFLFTSDSQQAEENTVFPTQQKYIIPGNANVIFDDTDNAVLVYGNIDSELVNSTSINEKITKNVNVTNSENINDVKNKINDMNQKFTRRDKEPTPKLEESRNELSTDTTDKMMTSFSEIPSDSVTTEESSTLEYVTNTKNIEISATTSISLPDIGSELSNITHNSSNLKNISENIIKNNKTIDIDTNFTVNKLADNELSSIIIERSPFNALESNSNLSNAVGNDVNTSHNDEIITDKAKELLNMATESYIQNTTYSRDISPNFSAHLNETISTLPEESVILTTSTPVKIATSNLNTPTEIYAQNDVFSRGIVLPDSVDFNSAGNVLKITTLRSDKLGDNENIIYFEDLVHPTTKVDNVTSHMSTTTKTYSLNGIMPNPIIPPESSELDITFGDILKVNKDITDLQTPKQLYFTEKAVLNSTIKPDNQESSKTTNYSSFDNDLHIKLGKYINKFNFDVRNSTGQDTITDKNFQIRNKNTNTANIDSESSNVSTDVNTEIITDKTILGMETLNSTLYTDVETITEFTTENVVTLQQTKSYQTTLRSNDLGEIKNTFFEDTDYSVLLFPASTVETLVTELSTTPKTYIQNDIITNPIIPNDYPDSDISFDDLIKGNEDFIELKSPLQIPFTDRPISDITGRSESRESLRNFRSTSQNNSSNYDIISNSSEKVTKTNDIFDRTETITHNISITNVTDPHDHFVNNEAVIVANKSTNKELLLNKTNTTLNFTLLFPNTKNVLNTAKIRKEIIEKIPNADEIISPRYNLTNHGLNITTDLDVKNYTESNKTQYSLGDEKRVIDKVLLSNVLLKNVTGYFQNLNEKDIEEGKKVMKLSSSTSSNSSSSSSSSSSDKKKNKSNKKSTKKLSNNTNGFKCNEEGKFVDPNNCRKYYICSKTSKSVLRRKRKKCDSDEVFDDDKKKCVDEDSYECK